MDKVSEVLDRAADRIEAGGWCQAAFRDEGRFCALGAIINVAVAMRLGSGALTDIEALVDPALAALAAAVGEDGVMGWNDRPGRTQEEVVAMLRAVAATERARENAGSQETPPNLETIRERA